jgi:hypothetical protein
VCNDACVCVCVPSFRVDNLVILNEPLWFTGIYKLVSPFVKSKSATRVQVMHVRIHTRKTIYTLDYRSTEKSGLNRSAMRPPHAHAMVLLALRASASSANLLV